MNDSCDDLSKKAGLVGCFCWLGNGVQEGQGLRAEPMFGELSVDTWADVRELKLNYYTGGHLLVYTHTHIYIYPFWQLNLSYCNGGPI